MILRTGFGILIKNGKKLRKFELNPGEHPDPIGYIYQEVASRQELNTIILDKSDEIISRESEGYKKIDLINSAKSKLKSILTDDELTALFGA